MWNNSNQLNNGSDVNVNTSLRTSTSSSSSMNMSLWNNYVSIKISPAIGVDANGVTQYDKTRSGKTALSAENCEALASEFKDKILPFYNKAVLEGEGVLTPISVTVETGKDPKRNIVGIEMAATEPGNTPEMYFVINGFVDANDVSTEANIYKHLFPQKKVKINHNPQTGVSDKEVSTNADFNIFLNIIAHVELQLPFSEHVKKYNEERNRMFNQRQSTNGYSTGYNGNSYGNNQSSPMNNPSSTNFASSGPVPFGAGYGSMLGGLDAELPFN